MADAAARAAAPASAPPDRAPGRAPEGRARDVMMRMWRDWLSPHWKRLLVNLALIAMVAGSTSAYPLIIRNALDAFETRDAQMIALAPWLVIVAVSAKSAALYAQRLQTNKILAEVDRNLQVAMYGALVRADLARLDREAPAATASRFTTDILVLHTACEKLITALIRDGLTVIGLLGALLWIDWELTLYALAALPAAAIPIGNIGRRLRRIARRSNEEAAVMAARVAEGLGGIRLSKTYRLEGYLARKAGETFESLRRLRVRAADQRARIDPFLEMLAGLGLAIIFWVIGSRIASGENSIGEFMAFVSSFLIAGQSLRGFGTLYAEIQQGAAAGERIFDVIDATPAISDRPGATALPRAKGEVRFEGVSFHYGGGVPALSAQRRLRPAGRQPRGDRAGPARRQRLGFRLGPARGDRHPLRRAGAALLGRRTAAADHRARDAQGRADPASGRADLGAGRGIGGQGARGAGPAGAGAHGGGDRAPALDHPRRRHHRGDGRRPHRGDRRP